MSRMFERSVVVLLSACCVILLASCGGGVSGAPAPYPGAGTPLAITPATADVLPGVPTTFTITGGAGGYTAFTSNASALPITSVTATTFTVTPNAVTADTTIDITVRDVANASATAKVTVKFTGTPLTVTPSTAELTPGVATTFTITGGRAGYSAFSSNSGALPIITANITGSTFTVIPNAVTADTSVDITVRDATNAAVTAKVTIKFVPGAQLTISPSVADLIPGIPTTFTITGGRAGYTAFSSNSGVLPIVTANVSGTSFTVTANAVNVDTPVDITVRDASNASVTAKVTVKFTGSPLTITPATADLVPGLSTSFTITGGRPGYTAFSSNNGVLPITTNVTGSTFTVTPNGVSADTVIDITVRDALNASATAKVTVKFTGTALAINPATAVVFPALPANFAVSGGSGAYSAFSSNAAVLTVPAIVTGGTITVIPNAVTVDTVIDITVRDERNASATARVTVRPSSLLNQITFTPLAPTGTGCGANNVCSGGDAQIVVKAVQNGVVLRNRQIRFEVFQGAFQLVTPGTGVLVNTLLINTDDQGDAVARLTANVGAVTQVATIQTTDVTSGQVRRYNFNIIQQVSGVGILSVLPSGTVTITGPKGAPGAEGSCPFGATVDYYIFGGTPPYSVASPLPGVATVAPGTVSTLGGRFTATITGCGSVSHIVTDASGRAIETSSLISLKGAQGDAVTVVSLTVTPATLSVACGTSGSLTVSGAGSFTSAIFGAGPSGAGLTVSPSAGALSTSGTNVSVSANAGTVYSNPRVSFSNGGLSSSVPITVTGLNGSGSCP